VNNIIEILVGIIVKNSKKLQKGVWKENSIEFIPTWSNDIGYINV
jgi:hypothetical protein